MSSMARLMMWTSYTIIKMTHLAHDVVRPTVYLDQFKDDAYDVDDLRYIVK